MIPLQNQGVKQLRARYNDKIYRSHEANTYNAAAAGASLRAGHAEAIVGVSDGYATTELWRGSASGPPRQTEK